MHLLNMIATPAQRARYLEPLVAGDMRSCFAMTEPPPGRRLGPVRAAHHGHQGGRGLAASDGEKHFITGADGAGLRHRDGGRREGPGRGPRAPPCSWSTRTTRAGRSGDDAHDRRGHRRRALPRAASTGRSCPTTRCSASRAGGSRYAQVRLAPARLTHCMRWLGAARRAHEIALARAVTASCSARRWPVARHGAADDRRQRDRAGRLPRAAVADRGRSPRATSGPRSRRGPRCSSARRPAGSWTGRCSWPAALGVTEELVIGRIYADIRAFRIYDGASEVHRMSIAKRVAARARTARS